MECNKRAADVLNLDNFREMLVAPFEFVSYFRCEACNCLDQLGLKVVKVLTGLSNGWTSRLPRSKEAC